MNWLRLSGAAAMLALSTLTAAAQERPGMDGLEATARAGARNRASADAIDLIGMAQAADFQSFFKQGGWESERDEPRRWTLDRGEQGVVLTMPSQDDSVQIGKKVGPIDANANPMLRLKIRIDKVPPGADISRKSKEDAAFRIFLAFDKKDGPMVPNTIGYAWTTSNEVGAFIRSDRSFLKNVWYVVLGQGEAQAGQWLTLERNVADDYRRAFKSSGPIPRVVAVALKADTNDTETSCKAALAEATLGK